METKNITLAKALSYKKRVSGEIARLTLDIRTNNSNRKSDTVEVDVPTLVTQRSVLVKHLIDLKTKLVAANTPIQGKIFELAEVKGEAALYLGLTTTHGKKLEDTYSGGFTEVEYVAAIRKGDVDRKLVELNRRTDQLQDELDKFNYSTTITVQDVGLF